MAFFSRVHAYIHWTITCFSVPVDINGFQNSKSSKIGVQKEITHLHSQHTLYTCTLKIINWSPSHGATSVSLLQVAHRITNFPLNHESFNHNLLNDLKEDFIFSTSNVSMRKKQKIIAQFSKIWIIHTKFSLNSEEWHKPEEEGYCLFNLLLYYYLLIFKFNWQIIIASIYGCNVRIKCICMYIMKWLNLDD